MFNTQAFKTRKEVIRLSIFISQLELNGVLDPDHSQLKLHDSDTPCLLWDLPSLAVNVKVDRQPFMADSIEGKVDFDWRRQFRPTQFTVVKHFTVLLITR